MITHRVVSTCLPSFSLVPAQTCADSSHPMYHSSVAAIAFGLSYFFCLLIQVRLVGLNNEVYQFPDGAMSERWDGRGKTRGCFVKGIPPHLRRLMSAKVGARISCMVYPSVAGAYTRGAQLMLALCFDVRLACMVLTLTVWGGAAHGSSASSF